MLPPLLTTKLNFPPLRGGLVGRPRLFERLRQGLGGPLTLISAPAGSGKTTLLSAWKAGPGKDFPAAWLSLDAGENDPSRFLAYLTAALEKLQPGITADTRRLLLSPQQEPAEFLLTSLINDLSNFTADFALILDDYHTLTSPAMRDAMTFLLEHQPPPMHLVILTRFNPPLPLARLRGRGQMVEIRLADLRFTMQEAADFLNEVMGLGLAASEIAALEERIEGWAVGLQLAAQALQAHLADGGREDAQSFVSAFTGSHHYIVEYLVEEVLSQQAGSVQDFLLYTSILERFNADLCHTLLGERRIEHDREGLTSIPAPTTPTDILEYLDKANLFLIPLDESHTWFRYHSLFADVLRGRLKQSQPSMVKILNQRAADWFQVNGQDGEAILHGLAAGNKNFVADLIERIGWATLMRGEWVTLAGWIKLLDETAAQRPVLGLLKVWTDTVTGQGNVEDGRIVLLGHAIEEKVDLDPKLKTALLSRVTALRGLLAYINGDVQAAADLCRTALAGLGEENWIDRSIVAHILGESSNRIGDLKGAIHANQEAKQMAKASGALTLGISAMTALGDLQLAQGKLHAALEEYEEALRFVSRPDGKVLLPAGRVKVCMSKIYYEWNDQESAGQSIRDCLELCRQGGDLEYQIIGLVMESRLKGAQGDLERARRAIQEARQLVKEHKMPATTISLVEGFFGRFLLRQDLPEAIRWAEKSGLKVTDPISYVHEWEYHILARVVAAQGEPALALSLLSRLCESAEQSGRWGWVIRYLVSQAVILQSASDQAEAEAALLRALKLGQFENYRRVFLDEGKHLAELLLGIRASAENAGLDASMSAYLEGLLLDMGYGAAAGLKIGKKAISTQAGLIEPLSERELEVLSLVAAGKTNQEIAHELFLAVGTVKRHLNNIFGKLDVQNRTQCVAKAREIKLL